MNINEHNASNQAPDEKAVLHAELDAADRGVMDLLEAAASRERAAIPAGFADRLFNASVDAYRTATPMRLVHGAQRNRAVAGLRAGDRTRRLFTPLRAAAALALIATVGAAMLAEGRRDPSENAADTRTMPIVTATGGEEEFATEADPSGVAGLLALALAPEDGVGAEIDRLRLDSMLISGVLLDESLAMPAAAGDVDFEHDAGDAGNSK